MAEQIQGVHWSRRFQLLLIIILLFIGGFVIVEKANKTSGEKEVSNDEVTPVSAVGVMSLSTKDCCSLKKNITLSLNINSAGVPINGFDAVVLFDGNALSYQSSLAIDGRFDLVTISKNGGLSIAGIKKSTEKAPILNGSEVVELNFKPLKAGSTKLTLKFEAGQTTESNIVSTGSSDILGEVTDLSVNITE